MRKTGGPTVSVLRARASTLRGEAPEENDNEIRNCSVFMVAVTSQFDFLSEEYATLFAGSNATAFQHPIWLDAIYNKLVAPLNVEPLIMTVRGAANGDLKMVLPLLRRKYLGLRTIEFADLGVSDYVAPVASQATIDAIAADPFTCRRIKTLMQPFDMLRIRKLQSSSEAIRKVLGGTVCSELPMSAYAVPLGSDFATWRVNSISASYRKELDKKSRQLHRKGKVVFDCASDVETIKATLLKMQEYRRGRFESGDLLQDQVFFDFYLDVAIRGRSTLARFYPVLMDGAPIAGAMALAHKGSLLVILTGFDHDNYKNQSLGSLIFEMVANHGIGVGDRVLDFTIGDEPYKILFGSQKSPIYQIFGSGSMAGAIAGAAVHSPWVKRVAQRFVK
ncbi:GNAT family N-acetyltransferase [Rhodoplanes sp. Z2-YC6860]|uniref:GNAT family N-acetyltransferase n=1 Tax=Rhodoplanes sp. Z2-YC6860 TaxID=674703 RepID=UPI000A031CDE|nr:GNAT family N-acetyltransferase [Rhodoplanes sp. Z2-YC6860]